MEIKFLDLKHEYLLLKPQIDTLIQEVLDSSEFVGGKYLKEFEKNFASFNQSLGCVGVGNGTDALEIAIKALNLPKNSEVILPVNTFFASLEAILNNNLKAVLVDCDENYLMDIESLKNAITQNTSAIMPVHLYGKAYPMEDLLKIANNFGLKIIEDCSQAHGAKTLINNQLKNVGSIGDIGCFSFYPGKNLGAYGDGGAIICNDKGILQSCYSIANHGIKDNKYDHVIIGRNSRLDNLQAGILNIKLKFLKQNNIYRQKIASLYNESLSLNPNFKLPLLPKNQEESVWHQYVIRLIDNLENKREKIQAYLQKNQINTSIHYPKALSENKIVYSSPFCFIHSDENARKYSKNILSLPIGTHIDKKMIHQICNILNEFY